MQAIHNGTSEVSDLHLLFQRAKIQDKCKQFTTMSRMLPPMTTLFQRAKIQDKCKQFTTARVKKYRFCCCFKEQRYKINASNSQLDGEGDLPREVVSKSKDTR